MTHEAECLRALPADRYLPCICGRLARVRADERERAAERVAALRLWDYCYDHDCRMQAGAVAAIRGGGA